MNTNDILSLSSMLSKPEPEIKGSGQKSEFNPGSIGSKNVLPPKEIPKDRDPLTAMGTFPSVSNPGLMFKQRWDRSWIPISETIYGV